MRVLIELLTRVLSSLIVGFVNVVEHVVVVVDLQGTPHPAILPPPTLQAPTRPQGTCDTPSCIGELGAYGCKVPQDNCSLN